MKFWPSGPNGSNHRQDCPPSSGYFKEDLKNWSLSERKFLGKKRYADLQTLSCGDIAKKLTVDITLFYGEKEAALFPELKHRAEQVMNTAKQSIIIVVPAAPHEIDFPAYQEAIVLEVSKIV